MTSLKLRSTDDARFDAVQDTFGRAIASGRLSENPAAPNYAGLYMYMGTARDGRTDAFKHKLTREYLPA